MFTELSMINFCLQFYRKKKRKKEEKKKSKGNEIDNLREALK